MALIQTAIALSLAAYTSFFFVYGIELFTTDFDTDFGGGIFDFLGNAFDVVGRIGQFLVFSCGNCDPPLPGTVQAFLIVGIGLLWFLIILQLVRGGGSS